MQGLLVSLAALQSALDEGQLEAADRHAHTIAHACDDQDGDAPDPALFGSRFLEIDRQLHTAAAELSRLAGAQDLTGAQSAYGDVVGACVACHEQAPTARTVRLGRLTETFGSL